MKLTVKTTTFLEEIGQESCFPQWLRVALADAVGKISAEERDQLRSKHESDSENFDGQIEKYLREANKDMTVKADHRVLKGRRFNHDLVIESEDVCVCVEIEKGYLSRFEFDVLKMQTFASKWHKVHKTGSQCFGAFIVPFDNVVASHISGNSRESSYQYLKRISELVAKIEPFQMDDILIIGYGAEEDEIIAELPKKLKRASNSSRSTTRGKPSDQVIIADGLLKNSQLSAIRDYPDELWKHLRKELSAKCPNLREKFNPGSKYFGYACEGSDAAYVYVQKRQLRIDVRIAADRADELRALGFTVKHVDNFQGKNGWLTGLKASHDCSNRNVIVDLLLEALCSRPE